MELGQKIQQILQHHPSVYVNGLGVFKHIHQASTYDEQRNVFLPPVNYIEFDAAATDGKDLAGYISQESEISRTEAEQTIWQTVGELKQQLKEYGKVGIDSLGELIRHGEGFVFKAVDLSAFQSDPVENTGSNPFVSEQNPTVEAKEEVVLTEEIDEEQVVEEPVGVFNAEEAVQETEPTVLATANIPPAEEPVVDAVEEEYEVRSDTNRVWYAVLAIVALSIVAIVWYMGKQGNEQETAQANTETQHVPAEVQPAVTDTTDSAGTVLLADTALAQVDAVPEDMREVIIPADHNWYIVIASRLPIADAERIKAEYNDKGHSSVRVLPNRSNDKVANVIWDSYNTKEQTDSALRYVRRNHVSDAWHTTVKK